jgi:hypothetical protein
MPGNSRRRQQQAQQFAAKLAASFPFTEPEDLLQFCAVANCPARFAPSRKQLLSLALGKGLCCNEHRHSAAGQQRPWRSRHRLAPLLVRCDSCGGKFIAHPRALVLKETRGWRLLCDSCNLASQNEHVLICPPCCRITDHETLLGCTVEHCLGVGVSLLRRTLPRLVASPLDEALWREIVERSAAHENPGLHRQLAVATRVGWKRRGQTQRWGADGRVHWRQHKA